jgi:hypothetical protein
MSCVSNTSNPFASSSSSSSSDLSVPNPSHLRAVPITDHIPIKLSLTESNYHAWKTYYYLLFREYNLRDHVDGTADLLSRDSD